MPFNISWAEYRVPRLAQIWRGRNIKLLNLRGLLGAGAENTPAGQAKFAHLIQEIAVAEQDEKVALTRIMHAEARHRQHRKLKKLRRIDMEELNNDPERKKQLLAGDEPEPEERSPFGGWLWFLFLWMLFRRNRRYKPRA